MSEGLWIFISTKQIMIFNQSLKSYMYQAISVPLIIIAMWLKYYTYLLACSSEFIVVKWDRSKCGKPAVVDKLTLQYDMI